MIQPSSQMNTLSIVTDLLRFNVNLLLFNKCIASIPLQKGFVILTIIVFLPRIAAVDMVLWDDTRMLPCDSQLWAIQCTWSSYRNN